MQQRQEDKYDTHLKILLIGNSRVGKSRLLQKFVGNPVDDFYCESLAIEMKETILNFFNTRIKLRVYDASGNPKMDFLVKDYLTQVDGAFVCFDVTNPLSFENVKNHIKKIKEIKSHIPIFLIGCKCDLSHAVSAEQIQALVQQGITYFETSSRNNVNIKEPFLQMTQNMYFSSVLNKVKPILEQQLENYLNSLPQLSNNHGLFASSSIKEDGLIEEFKNSLDKLCPTSQEEDLKDFFKETLAIIDRSDLLFASKNPVLSWVTTSPLSKTLKNTG